MFHLKTIAKDEPVAFKTEQFKLIIVEMCIQFAAVSHKRSPVHIVPDGTHQAYKLHIIIMVFYNHLEVTVHTEQRHGIQIRQYIAHDYAAIGLRKAMFIQRLHSVVAILLNRNQQHLCIYKHLRPVSRRTQKLLTLEGFTKICRHRHTATAGKGLENDLRHTMLIGKSKGQRALAYTDSHPRCLLDFFHVNEVKTLFFFSVDSCITGFISPPSPVFPGSFPWLRHALTAH